MTQKTILYAENQVIIQAATTRALEKKGYKVIEAGSPKEALGMYKENPTAYDLLVTNNSPPEQRDQGLALVKEIRKTDENFPIVLLSADNLDIQPGQKLGNTHAVGKLLGERQLLKTVESLIGQSQFPAGGWEKK